jgi:Mitochondrial K+-H+ exchange-related
MDVFLVPVGVDAYELYCEHVDDEPDAPAEEIPAGFWARLNPRYLYGRLRARFHQVLVEAERERRRDHAANATDGWFARVKRRAMRWVAESIAEQRLLWNLRRHDQATLHHPDDMVPDVAAAVCRKQLTRDFEKHRLWLGIDGVLMLVSGALILVPGPNVLGYFFAFRVVGHLFSIRGAKNGLDRVDWIRVPNPPLTDLRRALSLEPTARLREAEAVATRLRLDHLATFFQRTALSQ